MRDEIFIDYLKSRLKFCNCYFTRWIIFKLIRLTTQIARTNSLVDTRISEVISLETGIKMSLNCFFQEYWEDNDDDIDPVDFNDHYHVPKLDDKARKMSMYLANQIKLNDSKGFLKPILTVQRNRIMSVNHHGSLISSLIMT